MITLFIILGVVVVLGIATIAINNSIIRKRNTVDEALGHIETQLQRRFDLIPNLVETVKQYAAHERNTLAEVTAARNAAGDALRDHSIQGVQEATKQLDKAALTIAAVAESYPQLQASTNFLELQEELTTTENKVAFARQHYNQSAKDFNTGIQTIPGSWVAAGRFQPYSMFEVEEPAARKAPKVSFD